MTYKVFVDGQEGTTGLRIHELLAARDDVEVLRIAPEMRKDLDERRRLLNAADVAFLCLPDVAARESATLVTNPATCIIDASTAHRTDTSWAFGMPEVSPEYRARIRTSKRISNPGCHSTGFILAVRPLVAQGIMPSSYPATCFSLTGYSGGGRKMIDAYQAAGERWNAPRPYALGLTHKHLPEMRAHTGLDQPPAFVPIVGNFYKGMAVTVYLDSAHLNGNPDAAAIHAAFVKAYAGERFIRVMPLADASNLEDGFFNPEGSNDSNRVDLFVFGQRGHIIVIARLDNLGKGASGAAVQAMNLHLGCDEGKGLPA